ncbi:putative capsid maturation protease [Crucian carp herpesvirus]|nr:putative capsid maturation protease [Cyprinid herpesvirus 2]APB92925.2 putative capsid maturation protease [Crucian carp herpesvirus]QAU54800.1 putative capsid maturation protease [Cyprinid herpesvirus 2]QIM55239.1 putative capsid maturation protease [Cyprinid herpesvirus 2]
MGPHLRSRPHTGRLLTESQAGSMLRFWGRRPDGSVLILRNGALIETLDDDPSSYFRTLPKTLHQDDLVPIYCDRCLPYTRPWSDAPNCFEDVLPDHGYTVIGTAGVFSRTVSETRGMEQTSKYYHLPLKDLELFTHTQASNKVLLVHSDIPIGKIICYWHVHDPENNHCAVNAFLILTDQSLQSIFTRCKGLSWTTTSVIASEISLVGVPGRAASLIHKTHRLSEATRGDCEISRQPLPHLKTLGYGGQLSKRAAATVMASLSESELKKLSENPEDQRKEWRQMVEMLMGQLDLLYEATIAKGDENDVPASKRYLTEGRELFNKLHELKAHLEKLESSATEQDATTNNSTPGPKEDSQTKPEGVEVKTPAPAPPDHTLQKSLDVSHTSVVVVPPSANANVVPPSAATNVVPPSANVVPPEMASNTNDIRDVIQKALADVLKPHVPVAAPPPPQTGMKDFLEMFKLVQQLQQPAAAASVAQPAQTPVTHQQYRDDDVLSASSSSRGNKRRMELTDDDFKLFKKLREQDEQSRVEKERTALKEQLKKEMMAEFAQTSGATTAAASTSGAAPAQTTDVKQLVADAIKETLAALQQQAAVLPAPAPVQQQQQQSTQQAVQQQLPISTQVANLAAATGRTPSAAAVLQSAINNVHEASTNLLPSGLNLGVAGVPVAQASTLVEAQQQQQPTLVSVSAGLTVPAAGSAPAALSSDAQKMLALMMDH